MMGRSSLLAVLFMSVLLLLSFSDGFERKVTVTVEYEDSTVQDEETEVKSREMMELMDYKDPGPNTNPKTGYLLSPPPQG